MKKYLIILFIPFIFAASIQDMHKAVIGRKNVAGGSNYNGCTGADWCEDCEAGSYYYGFDAESETNATIGEYTEIETYTGTSIFGSKAMLATYGTADSGKAYVYENLDEGAQTTLWGIQTFWLNSHANWGANDYIEVGAFGASGMGTIYVRIYVKYDGSNYTLQSEIGTIITNPKTTNLSVDTAYQIKYRYIASTDGTDAQLDVWVKEAEASSYTLEIDVNNGDTAAALGMACFGCGLIYHSWANDGILIVDDCGYDIDGDPDP